MKLAHSPVKLSFCWRCHDLCSTDLLLHDFPNRFLDVPAGRVLLNDLLELKGEDTDCAGAVDNTDLTSIGLSAATAGRRLEAETFVRFIDVACELAPGIRAGDAIH